MSSSSPEDEDCILAVKFVGPQLSLCRHPAGKDAKWFNFRIADPSFSSSRVMYSKTDKMFSMPAYGGAYKGSWDLLNHRMHDLEYAYYPEFVQSEWEEVSMYCRSEHLVESPTGPTFLVKWFTKCCSRTRRPLWERFLVFEMDSNKVVRWTRDIGDVCIFLSAKGEPFCLKASSYGLSPNCIYYVGSYDFGKVNISDNVRFSSDNVRVSGGLSNFTSPLLHSTSSQYQR